MAPRNRNPGRPGKSRAWCFTINNPNDDERAALRSLSQDDRCSYIVVGTEVGESGTEHLQGFVHWKSQRSLAGLKKVPGFARAHLERMRGTHRQAADYCKKDGNFWEAGTPPRQGQGRRSDLEEIKEQISEGKTERYIADNHFTQWVVYRRSFDAYRRLLAGEPRKWKTWVNVLVGPTGTGKTRFVYQQHPDDDVYVWGGDRWFDGYCGQRVALLDDFRGELTVGFLLRLLDRYPLQVPIKGGFVNWNPKRCYITTNHLPEFWWESGVDRKDLQALMRRIDRLDLVEEELFE